MVVYDCTTTRGLLDGVAAAVVAARSGKLVVLPTDTVYGVGCDAFDHGAVRALARSVRASHRTCLKLALCSPPIHCNIYCYNRSVARW